MDASTPLAARVARVTDRPPLADIAPAQRDELSAFVAQARALEDLPGKWQAAIVAAEQSRPAAPGGCCGGH